MEQSPSWKATSHSASLDIPRLIWNPKYLPCSQELATGSYSEQDESSPQLPTLYP
jgi:hypothetical protein